MELIERMEAARRRHARPLLRIMFICTDASNVRNAKRILGGDPEGKLRLPMDYTIRPGDVSDPWYTGDFETAYRDISAGCQGLLACFNDKTRE